MHVVNVTCRNDENYESNKAVSLFEVAPNATLTGNKFRKLSTLLAVVIFLLKHIACPFHTHHLTWGTAPRDS